MRIIKKIKNSLKGNNEKFIFAYCPEPDHTEHLNGPFDLKVGKILSFFSLKKNKK